MPDRRRTHVIVLPAEEQPKVNRPVLDSIRQSAEEQGIPLEEAVQAYIDHVAATDPDAWASMPDGRVETPDVMIDDLHTAELQDLMRIAEAEGVTFAEAIEAHGWQGRFTEVAEELMNGYHDEYSGAARIDDGSSAWFGFKNVVPDRAVELARTLPVRVELVGKRGFSEVDIVAASHEIHDVIATLPATGEVATSPEIKTGTIEVTAEPRRPVTTSAERKALAASIESVLPPVGFPVTVTIVDDMRIEPQHP